MVLIAPVELIVFLVIGITSSPNTEFAILIRLWLNGLIIAVFVKRLEVILRGIGFNRSRIKRNKVAINKAKENKGFNLRLHNSSKPFVGSVFDKTPVSPVGRQLLDNIKSTGISDNLIIVEIFLKLDYLREYLTLHNYKSLKKCVPREAVRTESTCIDFIGEAGEDKSIIY